MKLVLSDPKIGRSVQMQLDKDKETIFLNHKVNDVIDGTAIGLSGYKLKITGGSDSSGFPMERSITGGAKRKILKKVSNSGKNKGQYRRMTVRGNLILEDVEQVNAMIVEYGDKPTSEIFPESPKKSESEAK